MKKLFQTLFLISFLAVLAAPTVISAATCGNCVTPPALPNTCTCGSVQLAQEGDAYCYNGYQYPNLGACQAAMTGGTGTTGEAPLKTIPTNVPATPGALVAWIEKIGNWIFSGLLALAAVYLVVAGYYFVMAREDPDMMKKAKGILVQSLIGVGVALASRGIIMIIQSLVTQ